LQGEVELLEHERNDTSILSSKGILTSETVTFCIGCCNTHTLQAGFIFKVQRTEDLLPLPTLAMHACIVFNPVHVRDT
jgi:hypothetical protein